MPRDFHPLPKTRAEAKRLGIDRFFTGKPCRHGHIAPRYVSSPCCAHCQVEHARKYGGWKARPTRSEYLNMARAIVEARGGDLLSRKYVTAKAKLRARCERGHDFTTTFDSLRHGRWCALCKAENTSKRQAANFLTLVQLNEIARRKHGGSCLAEAPASMHTRVLWKCRIAGHPPFRAAISNVVHQNNWCPACDAERRKLYPPKPAIPRTTVEAHVMRRGGAIVGILGGGKWQGLRTRLKIRCANGHEWDADANNLMHAGSWCPYCKQKGERIVRGIFEATFDGKFPKSKPAWLSEATGRKLELDGFNEALSLAFEYQGPHHVRDKSVAKTDALKRAACRARGVRLIEIAAVKRPFPPENVLQKVAAAFRKAGMKAIPRLPLVELFEAELAALRSLAAERGGKLVTARYLGSEPHEWKCLVPEHAPWSAEPWRIRRGAWCASCAGNRRLGIEGLRQWGARHGLELLRTKYRGTQAIYSWRCKKAKHSIRRSKSNIGASVRKGHDACTFCAREKRPRQWP